MLNTTTKKTKLILQILGVVSVFGVSYLLSDYNYLLFHSLAELFSIIVALGAFMMAWKSRYFLTNNYITILGIAILFIAGIDTIHLLAYKGMNIFKEADANLPTQLWIAARSLQAITILIAPFFLGRKKLSYSLVMLGYAFTFIVIMMSIFYWKIFPDCFIEGAGLTTFKIVSEYIISLALLISIGLLSKKHRYFKNNVLYSLIAFTVLTIGSELAFTFYISVYGASNLIGHIFKIFAFYFLYKAVIETDYLLKYPHAK